MTAPGDTAPVPRPTQDPNHPIVRPMGTRAVLVELADIDEVMALAARLRSRPLSGQVDVVAAARTVLVTTDSQRAASRAREALATHQPAASDAVAGREVTVDVRYDGPDLADTADALGLSPEALVRWHTGTEFVGAFGGFAPGFTYCVPARAGEGLRVPRLASPRTAVPVGAVGLADNFSAVYPRTSPGGWRLIGRSPTPMWDPTHEPPALIRPGDRVRYRAVEHAAAPSAPPEPRAAGPLRVVATLVDAGLVTLVEDRGRPGHADLGVTASGVFDRSSAAVVNMVLGNPADDAVLENIGGLALEAAVDTVAAVAGAHGAITVSGREVPAASPILVPADETLRVGPARDGLRGYVGLRGGIVTGAELGSMSRDVLSGLGPAPLREGSALAVRAVPGGIVGPATINPLSGRTTLRVVPGPRDDWFAEGVAALTERSWTVTPRSDRVGVRLAGPPIQRLDRGELPSEGMVAGAIQIPPDGQPVLFGPDHPTTGGYPVIAVVVDTDIGIAAQLRPGDTVRFTALSEGGSL